MKNYISFNAKYYKKDRVQKIHHHNTRQSEIDYLIKPILPNITDTNLIEVFSEKYIQMKKIATKNRSYVKEYGNHIIEAVVAVSEDLAKQIIQEDGNADRLYKGFQQVAQDIKTKYGFEPLQVSLHLDEGHKKQINSDKTSPDEYNHNIHCHITFLNYDFDKERTVLRTLKKADWENMQDLSAKAFKKHKLDFKRGKKKLSKSKDHLERNEYVAQEQLKQIELLQSDIDKIINEKRDLIINLKQQRKSLSKIEMEVAAKKEQYKTITQSQKLLRDEVKQLRADKANLLKKLKTKESVITDTTTKNSTLSLENSRLKNKITLLENTTTTIKELQAENHLIQSENSELIKDIEALEKEYKFNYTQWKKSRESSYSKLKKSKATLKSRLV